jgi:uncharacterized membrane protein
MIDTVLSWTELPNLHPAVVHFPIAFVVLAFLFEIGGLFARPGSWLGRAATATWVAAGLGAGLAYWAGRRAADSLLVEPAVQTHVNTHADWGLYSLWLVGVLAALRLAVALWRRGREQDSVAVHRATASLFVLAGVAAIGVVGYTADLGGGLVFGHGVAVSTGGEDHGHAAEGGPSETPEIGADPAGRLIEGEDGRLTWRPAPGDAAALGGVLAAAPGSSADAVSAGPTGPDAEGASGLALAVDGRSALVLPGTFGDVQVEAELDLSGFEGTAGLAHHVRGAGDLGLFTVERPAGRFALTTLEGGEPRSLGSESGDLREGPARFVVSAIGRHLRGLVDGEMVVHGHEPALSDGACGLFLDGRGTVRVIEMKVIPASD